jgi:hypothetical protein
MAEPMEYNPGDVAPKPGSYQLHNVFGSPTHHIVSLEVGESMPDAPRGFIWRLIEQSDNGED